MSFNKQEFLEFAADNGVVNYSDEPITLKSGKQSHWYVNWRVVAEDAKLLQQLANFIIDFAEEEGLEPDTFYGVPEGATKVGIITQYEYAKKSDWEHSNLSMGRGKVKHHGMAKDRYFVGIPEGRTVVIEDVTTTGTSLLEAIDNLTQVKIDVVAAICLTDRCEKPVQPEMERLGMKYYPMSTAADFVNVLKGKNDKAARAIEGEI